MNQLELFAEPVTGYEVKAIKPQYTHHLLLNVHYAKRIPPITKAFGLFLDSDLVGVITFGMPASPALCKGVCGEEYKGHVLELNRLCLVNNLPNEASRLVGGALRLLKDPFIIVSYADTAQSHEGIIYRATNFLYTGLTASRSEWTIKGLEHMHSKAISNGNDLSSIKEKYGDDFYYRERSRKHRYITFTGNKTERKAFRNALKYQVTPYPKQQTKETNNEQN
jgi:hypothetical protein